MSSPNERSRAYLAVALVDHGTITINKPIKRFGKILDISKYEKNVYTDKAPGSGFIAAGIYASARLFSDPEDWTVQEILNLFRTFLMIPLAVSAFWMVRKLLFSFNCGPVTVDIVSLAFSLGSVVFHYSTVFLGHHIVLVLALSAVLLERMQSGSRFANSIRFFAIGLSAGLAGFTEYQSVLWCVPFSLFVFFRHRKDLGLVACFFLGAAIFVALLLLYNYHAYGNPLELSYHHLTHKMQAHHQAGVAGVSFPKFGRLLGVLFSLHRGLFVNAPLFVLAIPGLYCLFRGKEKEYAFLISTVVLGYLLFVSGAEIWHGGWAFGPRLLIPMIGFMTIPTAIFINKFQGRHVFYFLFLGLFVFGLIYNQITSLVFKTFPPNCLNPFMDAVIPAMKDGDFVPNLMTHHFGVVNKYASIFPALIAIMSLIVFVSFKYIRIANIRGKARLLSLLQFVPCLLLAAIMIFIGTSWKEDKVKSFNGWINKMNKHEATLIE